MKKLSLLIILALTIQFTLSAQSCLPEGIGFYTQAEIDDFQTNYPNCTEIEGGVWITGGEISNLNGLFFLTSIGEDLLISGNAALTSLAGLNNLTFLGGELLIIHN